MKQLIAMILILVSDDENNKGTLRNSSTAELSITLHSWFIIRLSLWCSRVWERTMNWRSRQQRCLTKKTKVAKMTEQAEKFIKCDQQTKVHLRNCW